MEVLFKIFMNTFLQPHTLFLIESLIFFENFSFESSRFVKISQSAHRADREILQNREFSKKKVFKKKNDSDTKKCSGVAKKCLHKKLKMLSILQIDVPKMIKNDHFWNPEIDDFGTGLGGRFLIKNRPPNRTKIDTKNDEKRTHFFDKKWSRFRQFLGPVFEKNDPSLKSQLGRGSYIKTGLLGGHFLIKLVSRTGAIFEKKSLRFWTRNLIRFGVPNRSLLDPLRGSKSESVFVKNRPPKTIKFDRFRDPPLGGL